mmetsp:Transcript_11055/g.24343  ORF Transcript_11055/g.24343 Transcript_11055/m.24343 type:complete len:208 (+) Transcript_11055:1679-2302(+)
MMLVMSVLCCFSIFTYSSSLFRSSSWKSLILRSFVSMICLQAFFWNSSWSFNSCGMSMFRRSAHFISMAAFLRPLVTASICKVSYLSSLLFSSTMRRWFSWSSNLTRMSVNSSHVSVRMRSKTAVEVPTCCLPKEISSSTTSFWVFFPSNSSFSSLILFSARFLRAAIRSSCVGKDEISLADAMARDGQGLLRNAGRDREMADGRKG